MDHAAASGSDKSYIQSAGMKLKFDTGYSRLQNLGLPKWLHEGFASGTLGGRFATRLSLE
jgi:hypothetical protein